MNDIYKGAMICILQEFDFIIIRAFDRQPMQNMIIIMSSGLNINILSEYVRRYTKEKRSRSFYIRVD